MNSETNATSYCIESYLRKKSGQRYTGLRADLQGDKQYIEIFGGSVERPSCPIHPPYLNFTSTLALMLTLGRLREYLSKKLLHWH